MEEMVGKRFGKLVIIEFEKRSPNVLSRCTCRCDCGNTIEIGLAALRKKTSCGCDYLDPRVDITGKKYGKENTTMKKVLMIVGSMRKKSFNRQLAAIAAELLRGKAEVSFLEYADIPYMNQDIEFPVPEEILRMRDEVSKADGIWIITPEYNYSYPGVLKNLLDWLSRPTRMGAPRTETAIAGKKVTISGVGGKSATANVRAKLKDLLQFMQVDLMEECETGVALDTSAFQTNILNLSEETKASLQKQVDAFLKCTMPNLSDSLKQCEFALAIGRFII